MENVVRQAMQQLVAETPLSQNIGPLNKDNLIANKVMRILDVTLIWKLKKY